MVKKIAKRVVELRDKKQQLHKQLDPEVEVVLRGKSLLIWKELMEQTSFADECIFDEMKSGFKLCGQASVSGAFPLGHQPAQQSVDVLRKQAKWLRAPVTIFHSEPDACSERSLKCHDLQDTSETACKTFCFHM